MITPLFADGALRLAGLACRAFGWTPDGFWAATPAELAAMLRAGTEGEAHPLTRQDFNRLMERDRDG